MHSDRWRLAVAGLAVVLGACGFQVPPAHTGSFSDRTRELDRLLAGKTVWLDVHNLYWDGRFYPEGPYEVLGFSETGDPATVAIGLEYQGRLGGPFPERSIPRQALWWLLFPPKLGRRGTLLLDVPQGGDPALLLEGVFHATPPEERARAARAERQWLAEQARDAEEARATAQAPPRSPDDLARERHEAERNLIRLGEALHAAREAYDELQLRLETAPPGERAALRQQLIAAAQQDLGPALARFQSRAEAYVGAYGEAAYDALARDRDLPALGITPAR